MKTPERNNVENLNIRCSDGITLSAKLYHSPNKIKAVAMLCPATGIKQKFYSNFAAWLATQGYPTITFDNRGIGESLNGHVKSNSASIIDWGALDMPAVLETLKVKYPKHSYHLVGHSAGGQLVGLMSNASDLKSVFNFACSSGNLSNMKFPFKFQAHFFMNAFIPLSNLFFGYTKSRWIGMGESLPKKAAQQWRRWCNGEGYLKTDFGGAIKTHSYDTLRLDMKWVYASDDDIANRENVKEMQAVYSACRADFLELKPLEFELNEIGHMGFFKRNNQHLWPLATDWLKLHT